MIPTKEELEKVLRKLQDKRSIIEYEIAKIEQKLQDLRRKTVIEGIIG